MYEYISFPKVYELLDATKHHLKDLRYIVAGIGVVTAVVLSKF